MPEPLPDQLHAVLKEIIEEILNEWEEERQARLSAIRQADEDAKDGL